MLYKCSPSGAWVTDEVLSCQNHRFDIPPIVLDEPFAFPFPWNAQMAFSPMRESAMVDCLKLWFLVNPLDGKNELQYEENVGQPVPTGVVQGRKFGANGGENRRSYLVLKIAKQSGSRDFCSSLFANTYFGTHSVHLLLSIQTGESIDLDQLFSYSASVAVRFEVYPFRFDPNHIVSKKQIELVAGMEVPPITLNDTSKLRGFQSMPVDIMYQLSPDSDAVPVGMMLDARTGTIRGTPSPSDAPLDVFQIIIEGFDAADLLHEYHRPVRVVASYRIEVKWPLEVTMLPSTEETVLTPGGVFSGGVVSRSYVMEPPRILVRRSKEAALAYHKMRSGEGRRIRDEHDAYRAAQSKKQITNGTIATGGPAWRYDNSENNLLHFQCDGLPKGLKMDSKSGIVTGIPMEAGRFAVLIIAIDQPDIGGRYVVSAATPFDCCAPYDERGASCPPTYKLVRRASCHELTLYSFVRFV